MARAARKLSESGIYHIIFRGVNHQNIFEDTADYRLMTTILTDLQAELSFVVYSYCLMPNHVHIVLKENEMGDISLIMKRLLTKYVRRYNQKYQRSGALIANRYKSEAVEVDSYFLNLIRYVHQNPIKAGLTQNLAQYPYSSYRAYLGQQDGLTQTSFLFEMMDEGAFEAFHVELEQEIFEVNDKTKPSDTGIRRAIISQHQIEPKTIAHMPKFARDELLAQLKLNYTIRQLERVTGISRGVIHKASSSTKVDK